MKLLRACGLPKNSQLRPLAPVIARSCTKPRNGATPVPGPTRMTSRVPSFGKRKRSLDSMKTGSFSPSAARAMKLDAAPQRRLSSAPLPSTSYSTCDGQVRFLAHGPCARRDRIQAWHQWTQGGDEFPGAPCARITAQQVDDLLLGQQPREIGGMVRVEQGVELVVPCMRGMGCHERPRQTGEFALARQPFAQRQRLPVVVDGLVAVERKRRQYGVDQRRRIHRPDAERIAGFVMQARTFQRQLDMANILA